MDRCRPRSVATVFVAADCRVDRPEWLRPCGRLPRAERCTAQSRACQHPSFAEVKCCCPSSSSLPESGRCQLSQARSAIDASTRPSLYRAGCRHPRERAPHRRGLRRRPVVAGPAAPFPRRPEKPTEKLGSSVDEAIVSFLDEERPYMDDEEGHRRRPYRDRRAVQRSAARTSSSASAGSSRSWRMRAAKAAAASCAWRWVASPEAAMKEPARPRVSITASRFSSR